MIDPVWKLYERAIQRAGKTATLLEWDARIPSFDEVHDEALKAEQISQTHLKTKPSRRVSRQTRRNFTNCNGSWPQPSCARSARGDGMQSKWTDGRPTKKVAESFIKPNDRLTSFERLEIYNRQYWFRLRDCFYEDYPGLRAILGDKKFERLADAYLARYPSQSFTLRNLGSRLVKFLEAKNRAGLRRTTQLALDMARLEWAHIEAFDNEARPPLSDRRFGRPGRRPQIRLQLQPHLTLLKLDNEVDDFLIELKKNSGLRSEASNAMEQNRRAQKNAAARAA